MICKQSKNKQTDKCTKSKGDLPPQSVFSIQSPRPPRQVEESQLPGLRRFHIFWWVPPLFCAVDQLSECLGAELLGPGSELRFETDVTKFVTFSDQTRFYNDEEIKFQRATS